MTGVDEARAEIHACLGEDPADLAPLTGGAGQSDIWTFRAGHRSLVLRRQRWSAVRAREWTMLQLAHAAGLPVPAPVAQTPSGLIMEHVAGEGRPRPLLNDDRFEGARAVLVAEVAETAARLHALPAPDDFPKRYPLAEGAASSPTPAGQALADLEALLDDTAEPHPAVELGLRWLHHHLPAPAPWSIVHGDLRLSNLIVGEEGLRALVDWEAAHAGDGAEDLGWMCIRSWRFGRDQLPALGCGTREELLAAYVAGGGRTITPEELRWWEVCGNARWAVICLAQARAVHGGAPPDLEHAMIGRRACEAEWDLLQLLSDARPLPPPVSAPQDAPDAAQLLALVASYLHDEVRPAAPSGHRFRLLVAANACSVVTRELASDFAPSDAAGAGRTAALAAELRAGHHDDRLEELVDPLRAATRWRLAVAHPGWDAG